MNYNSYIWHLYKNSQEGQAACSFFANLAENLDKKKGDFIFNTNSLAIDQDDISRFWIDAKFFKSYFQAKSKEIFQDWEYTKRVFQKITQEDFILRFTYSNGDLGEYRSDDILELLPGFSLGLYLLRPEYFFPYLFDGQFDLFEKICKLFEIPIPEIPPKRDRQKRLLYYLDICLSLHEFRVHNNLSPEELCAFFYSFSPNFISKEIETELPQPTKIWIVGGGINNNGDFEYLDDITEESQARWHGNIRTRQGDIVVMYCLRPRSYIHSIWRALSDGFDDAFFYFKSSIRIGKPQKIIPVSYREMKEDSTLSKNGLIKRSMQGVNGVELSIEEYDALLKLTQQKGQDISLLPKVDSAYQSPEFIGINNERDVEIHLVEPFLQKLGYQPADWVRQMTIHMGRGERYYPDYAIFPKMERGNESAKMLIETKYRISTEKQRFQAYCQAKSYALRLQSSIFVLVALDGLWIFSHPESKFKFEDHIFSSWVELRESQAFSRVSDMTSKERIQKIS